MKNYKNLRGIVIFMVLLILASHAIPRVLAQEPASIDQPAQPGEEDIVGGREARPHAYPSQAWVILGSVWCGGSLIDPSWVLIAAHCPYVSPTNIRVGLGLHNRIASEGTKQWIPVDRVIIHEDFDNATNDNDIALLHLAYPPTLNEFVQPVSLVSANPDLPDGLKGIVIGWGETGMGTSNVLMEAEVPLVNQQVCEASYKTYNPITANMLCAGYAKGGIDACYGDSGGPWFVPAADGSRRLAGIVSWGLDCALPNYYGVYTRVSNYIDWINTNIGQVLPVPTLGPTTTPTPTPTPTAVPTAPGTPTPPPMIAGISPNTHEVEGGETFTNTLMVYNTTDITQTGTLQFLPGPVDFKNEGWTVSGTDGNLMYEKSFTVGPKIYIAETLSWQAPTKPKRYWVASLWPYDPDGSGFEVTVKGSTLYLPTIHK